MGDIAGTERIGHLLPAPLLGGEAAIREPWRMALAMVYLACGKEEALEYFAQQGDKAALLLQAGERGINAPATTGAGRLFDAVAALAGVRTHTTYEGQAAIDLEQVLDDSAAGSYGFDIAWEGDMMIFDWRQLIRDVVRDARKGLRCGEIAAKFHRAVVQLLADVSSWPGSTTGAAGWSCREGFSRMRISWTTAWPGLRIADLRFIPMPKLPANDGGYLSAKRRRPPGGLPLEKSEALLSMAAAEIGRWRICAWQYRGRLSTSATATPRSITAAFPGRQACGWFKEPRWAIMPWCMPVL